MAFDRRIYRELEEIVGKENVSEEPAILETYRCASVNSACHYGPYDNRTPTRRPWTGRWRA